MLVGRVDPKAFSKNTEYFWLLLGRSSMDIPAVSLPLSGSFHSYTSLRPHDLWFTLWCLLPFLNVLLSIHPSLMQNVYVLPPKCNYVLKRIDF